MKCLEVHWELAAAAAADDILIFFVCVDPDAHDTGKHGRCRQDVCHGEIGFCSVHESALDLSAM